MYSLVQIDKHSFDTTIEHFSFPPFHRIEDMGELTKLSFLPRLRSATFTGTGLDDRGLLVGNDGFAPSDEVIDVSLL